MASRIILRVEVDRSVPAALDEIVAQFGMTHLAVNSKLLSWFVTQDELVQASVLGLYPAESEQPDILRMILNDFAHPQKSKK